MRRDGRTVELSLAEVRSGDLVLVMSVSGNSPNLVKALDLGKGYAAVLGARLLVSSTTNASCWSMSCSARCGSHASVSTPSTAISARPSSACASTQVGSVAAALSERGFTVTGSDENVYPPMSTFLEKRNIALFSGYRAENIPANADVVVIGNAIKRGNPEAEAILNRKLFYLSLPEVLKNYFLRGRHNLVVTGTHGKTTTTALLAWIMEKVGRNPGYLIAGLPKNFGQGARLNDSKYFVIEGDEYDTAFFDKRSKFIHYLPELLIVNNIEFDHADIFKDLDEIKLSFRRLLNIVPNNGMVLLNGDDPNSVEVAKDCLAQMVEVGFSKNCAQRIRDVSYSSGASRFKLGDDVFEIPLVGEFNVHNAAMAATAARFYDVPSPKIRAALKNFSGIARRVIAVPVPRQDKSVPAETLVDLPPPSAPRRRNLSASAA